MRMVAFALVLCAISRTATAQTSECKSIADPAARLACYDRSTPPAAASAAPRSALQSPALSASRPTADDSKAREALDADDALVTARMNGICRGC